MPYSRASSVMMLGLFCILISGCSLLESRVPPGIEFTEIPEAAGGGAARMEKIAGRVIGSRKRGEQIVLFARSGTWWVQPFSSKPFTPIRNDSTWDSQTHTGTEYAALLVAPGYAAPKTVDVLPTRGGAVIAAATVAGRPAQGPATVAPKTLHFSGYEWDVLQIPSDSGGVMHANSG